MQGNVEACAAGYQKLANDLQQAQADQPFRDALAHFDQFSSQQYKLHLPAAAAPLAAQVDCPHPLGAVNTALWTKDTFEEGSMQYTRRIVALQQLSYTHIFLNREFPGVDKQAVEALVRRFHNKPQDAAMLEELSQLKGPARSIAAYSALAIPRCPDVVVEHDDLRRRTCAYGFAVADALRLQKVLNSA